MIRTLVVDDDPDVSLMHQLFIGAIDGFEVAGAVERGGEVEPFMAAHPVDLVLLDVHLPDMDGLAVLERLRAAGHGAGVIMITAASDRESVRFAIGRGVDDYLVKPFTVTDFKRRLEAYRASRGSAPDAAGQYDAGPLAQAQIDLMLGAGSTEASGAGAGAGAAGTGSGSGGGGIAGGGPRAAQHGIAGAGFSGAGGTGATSRPPLPKGFAYPTLDLVAAALRSAAGDPHGDLSAREVAEACGISRVSARRYLDLMAERGMAELRPRYGTAGRPEHRYRWIAPAR